MATGNLTSVVVAVDGSEESMNALRWALDNLRLRPDGAFVELHVQPPPSIVAGLKPSIQAPSPSAARVNKASNLARRNQDGRRGGAGVHAGDRGAPAADHAGDPGARAQDLLREECGGGGGGPQGKDLRGDGQPQGRSARHGVPCYWAAQEVLTMRLCARPTVPAQAVTTSTMYVSTYGVDAGS